jgi:hypothetical protein
MHRMARKQPEPEILSRPANKRTAARLRVFLEVYQQTGRVNEAAPQAGISRMTHYTRLRSDPVYAGAFRKAEEIAAHELEDEAIRRARDGIRRPVMYRGQAREAEWTDPAHGAGRHRGAAPGRAPAPRPRPAKALFEAYWTSRKAHFYW